MKYLGSGVIDDVIISNTAVSEKATRHYARMHQSPVKPGNLDAVRKKIKGNVILADVGHEEELVRHDSRKIRDQIVKILKKK